MNERDMLLRAIERQEASYNPEKRAVTQPFSSPGYHTTLTPAIGNVHSTRTAAYYALALLDSGLTRYRRRAFDVLERLVDAQDTNPANQTFGIWSWFYEEPLERMSPPDWNWADFIGKPLLLVLKRHGETLPDALRARVESAVRNACAAIAKRNVGPHYTNIAIMGSFVTLCAGEWLGDADAEAYGLARLQRFYDYTMESGTFQEFNSPTYTTVAIEELSSLRTETRSEAARRLADGLLDIAWAMVAERFHPRTGQWAGPHNRAYSELLRPQTLSFLQLGLGGRAAWLDDAAFEYQTMWYGNDIRCPEKYAALFFEPRTTELVQPLLVDAGGRRREAVTYASPELCLGTVSHGDLWNQRRSLLGYVAAAEGPAYVHLRALHDGYDYTGAWLLAAQRARRVLFGVHLCTDGGDTHPSLDPIRDETIVARDLRLRFEIGGATAGAEASWSETEGPNARCAGSIGETPFEIDVAFAAFAGETVRYEVSRDGSVMRVDIVLYAGEPRTIAFASLGRAVVAGQFALGCGTRPYETAVGAETVELRLADEDGAMRVAAPLRPLPIGELTASSVAETERKEVSA